MSGSTLVEQSLIKAWVAKRLRLSPRDPLQVVSLLTSVPWQIIRDQLNDCLETVNCGYWKRHKRQGGTNKLNSPDFLEVHDLFIESLGVHLVSLSISLYETFAIVELFYCGNMSIALVPRHV